MTKKNSKSFFGYKLGLWDLRASRVIISFNNSKSSLSSPLDVGLRPNHINHCVFCFHFSYSFLPIIIFCHDLLNKLVSKLRLLDLE